jgi:hypothetical protein
LRQISAFVSLGPTEQDFNVRGEFEFDPRFSPTKTTLLVAVSMSAIFLGLERSPGSR